MVLADSPRSARARAIRRISVTMHAAPFYLRLRGQSGFMTCQRGDGGPGQRGRCAACVRSAVTSPGRDACVLGAFGMAPSLAGAVGRE
jgi:hypothetical protein